MPMQGQIALVRFPQADLLAGKLRPVLLLAEVPGAHGDWLVCMISSQVRHFVPDFDWIVRPEDTDFGQTGLKVASVIRLGRVAVLEQSLLVGTLGQLDRKTTMLLRSRLAEWLAS
jgi:mRNA interferase MazF